MKIMPFASWKKKAKKNSNLSQFFREHIQSHQRRAGGPLVVETGFPTSLVDLIVKNRQRLRRSSEIEVVPRGGPFVLESSPPPTLPSQPSSPPTLLNHTVEETPERDDTVTEMVRNGEECKGVLMAVLRVSFVVVLALGTKKFAVGLTMSAFFLIFVQFFGKHLLGLLIPCSDSKKELRSMMAKVLRFREENLEGKNAGFREEINKSNCSDFKNNSPSNKDSISEIQIVQPKSILVASDEDVQCKEKGIDKSDCDGNLKLRKPDSLAAFLEEEEEEYTCEFSEIKKKKKSRRVEMKSKLKHIFARKSKKEKKEGILESKSNLNQENNAAKEVVEGERNERKLECGSNLSSISRRRHEEEEAIPLMICGSDEPAAAEEATVVDGVATREVEGSHRNGSSGCLFLCILVLIGLSGGRISALLLILSCCLMKKSGGKLGRCLILPVIRHFCPDV